ncbi:unnamed protein product [Calicophoron daubneyi]|uniref:Uncharacterized protein n=1 Tax=Calicophoron daubneyi TaxID=300641 RepID=A0AAV2TLD2_CALDB
MNDCDALKAFNSLWSVTDKIFEHVADISKLLNTTCAPVAESSSDDPPSYESSTSEHLIYRLKEKVNCLEDLDKQRKLLYEQYTNKKSGCEQVENVHSEEGQQVLDEKGVLTLPSAPTPRDVAIKNLRSFLRTRQAAVTANHTLLVQIRQGLSALSINSFQIDSHVIPSWNPEEEKKFYAELKLLELFSSQTTKDRSSLLRNGKILEEKILSASHDTGEETSKLMRSVQDSHRQAAEIVIPTFLDLLLPILNNLPQYGKFNNLKSTLESVIRGIDVYSDQYLRTVATYQEALQDLADLIVP